jgi:hypothetical protein
MYDSDKCDARPRRVGNGSSRSKTGLGPAGGAAIADALASLTTLTSLDIRPAPRLIPGPLRPYPPLFPSLS